MNQRRKKLKFPKFRVKSAKCGGSNNPGGGTNPVDSNPQVPGGICLTVGGGKVGVKRAFPFTFGGTTKEIYVLPFNTFWIKMCENKNLSLVSLSKIYAFLDTLKSAFALALKLRN